MQGAIMIYAYTRDARSRLQGLRKGQLLGLDGRRGGRIASRRGAIWVTQDGDPNDVVLDAGQTLELEHDGPLLIQALDAACIAVDARLDRGLPTAWWQRLRVAVGLAPVRLAS